MKKVKSLEEQVWYVGIREEKKMDEWCPNLSKEDKKKIDGLRTKR